MNGGGVRGLDGRPRRICSETIRFRSSLYDLEGKRYLDKREILPAETFPKKCCSKADKYFKYAAAAQSGSEISVLGGGEL